METRGGGANVECSCLGPLPMSKKIGAIDLCEQVTSVMSTERWLDGIKLLKDNLAVVKKDSELSWNLAWCYFKLDRLVPAQAHMIRAVKLAPKEASCRFGLGAIYLEGKQFEKAETNCIESLRIKESYTTRLVLALAYILQGKLPQAEKVHLEGIRLKPKESQRYTAYADFLSDVGRTKQAQAMYRKAEKLGYIFPGKS
jgi:tetratricopeptide (TPR) repeat protein